MCDYAQSTLYVCTKMCEMVKLIKIINKGGGRIRKNSRGVNMIKKTCECMEISQLNVFV